MTKNREISILNFLRQNHKFFNKVFAQPIVNFKVNIKDNKVQIENLMNLNVLIDNKFKIEKKKFLTKNRENSILNFFTAKS